jgi:hypothetical protein
MQRKLVTGTVLAVFVAMAAVSLAFAGGRSHHGTSVRILHLTLQHAQDADIDAGDPGPSVGDRFTFSGPVIKKGTQVGMGGGECVTVAFTAGADPQGEPEVATDLCAAALSLAKGQITVQGLVDRVGELPVKLAITGGTGAYRTAHGELKTSGPDEQGNEDLILKLIL